MHKSMGNSIIIIEKERLIREGLSQEKNIGRLMTIEGLLFHSMGLAIHVLVY